MPFGRHDSNLSRVGASDNPGAIQFEAVTDPSAGSWFATNTNGEIADKCNRAFSLVTLANGDHFNLQMQWSNLAYALGIGTLDAGSEPGCMSYGQPKVSTSGPSEITSEGTYTWTATPSAGTGSYNYQWEADYASGPVYLGTGSSQSLAVSAADGDFTIKVSVNSGSYTVVSAKQVSNGIACAGLSEWLNYQAYYSYDRVCYQGRAWQSTLDGNIGNEPYDGSPYWSSDVGGG